MLLAVSAGCAVPYAYPRVDKTQSIRLDEGTAGVTAFRVEYTAAGNPRWDRRASVYRIALLNIDAERGEIPEQARVGIERGLYLYMFHLTHDLKVDEGVEVRLYKHGYRSVRVSRTYQGGPIRLQPALTAPEREDAIDTMFGPDVAGSATTQPADDPPVVFPAEELFLFWRARTSELSAACRFGADEYAALAVDATGPARDRLLAKEVALRRFVRDK